MTNSKRRSKPEKRKYKRTAVCSFFVIRASSFIRHSPFVIRHFYRTPHSDEFSRSTRFRFRGQHSGGHPLLPAQAQASREARLEHFAMAKIFVRNAGQRAVSETAEELAPYLAGHFAGA